MLLSKDINPTLNDMVDIELFEFLYFQYGIYT